MIKKFSCVMASITVMFGISHSAHAAYPDQTVKLVIPYSAGGPTDTFARVLSEAWDKHLGTTMIVENKAGAGTVVGTTAVANAKPDGVIPYCWLLLLIL